jgi:hypothetical protein
LPDLVSAKFGFWQKQSIFVVVTALLWALLEISTAYARKTNQTIIQDPFDMAAGGSSLTRSTRENVVLANPALMPYGAKLFRWLGTSFTGMVNKSSVDTLTGLLGGGESAEQSEESAGAADTINTLLESPVHLGITSLSSLTTNNIGVSIFARTDFDISAREFGKYGMPEMRVMGEMYGGAALGFGMRMLPFLSLGVTAKYIAAAEPDLGVSLLDSESIASLSNPATLAAAASYGTGLGYDVGLLLFLQGNAVDFRLAAKIEDYGGTSFTGTQATFLQIMNVGMAVTFHTNVDAIHLSLDLRDINAVYEELLFKRVYAGARLSLRKYVGIAAGLYHGFPSMGVRFDFIFFKVGATMYTREYGDYPGANSRTEYLFNFLTGF